jgi:multiple sugar transport system substrate-binding protein
VQAFTLARAARRAGIDARVAAWSSEWSEGFRRDRVATQMMGSWLAGHLKNWIAPADRGPVALGAAARRRVRVVGRLVLGDPGARRAQGAGLGLHPHAVRWTARSSSRRSAARCVSRAGGRAAGRLPRAAHRLPRRPGRAPAVARRQRRVPALHVDRYDQVANDIVNAELDQVLEARQADPAGAGRRPRRDRTPRPALLTCRHDPIPPLARAAR